MLSSRSNCDVDEHIKSIDEVGDCPFLTLDGSIEHLILQQLDFTDLKNLTLSCRHWYKSVSQASLDVKRNFKFKIIHAGPTGLIGYNKKGKKTFLCKLTAGMSLVNKIKCGIMTVKVIDPSPRSEGIPVLLPKGVLEFLNRHRSHFEIERLCFVLPIVPKDDNVLMKSVCGMAPWVTFDGGRVLQQWYHLRAPMPMLYLMMIKELILFQQLLTHSHIVNNNKVPVEIVNSVLKQWIDKKRPNLEFFSSLIHPVTEGNVIRKLVRGAKDYLGEQKHDKVYSVDVVVPGLPVLHVSLKGNRVMFKI